jgi:Fe-S cluster assembly protein SufD
MALPQAKQDVLAARIVGLSLPQGGWAGAARADALARLGSMGMPV